jgi:hypothetical protein
VQTIHRIWDLADDLVARHNEQAEGLAELLTLMRRVAPDEREIIENQDADLRCRPCLLCMLGAPHTC